MKCFKFVRGVVKGRVVRKLSWFWFSDSPRKVMITDVRTKQKSQIPELDPLYLGMFFFMF
jgi:hypothetical protein